MNKSGSSSLSIIFVTGVLLVLTNRIAALESIPYVFGHKSYASDVEEADPEMMFAILARLGQTIIRANDVENSKRGLDLGLSRGYSGSQQAKHMMGIAAAGLSGGPGRRRRSNDILRYRLPNYLLEPEKK